MDACVCGTKQGADVLAVVCTGRSEIGIHHQPLLSAPSSDGWACAHGYRSHVYVCTCVCMYMFVDVRVYVRAHTHTHAHLHNWSVSNTYVHTYHARTNLESTQTCPITYGLAMISRSLKNIGPRASPLFLMGTAALYRVCSTGLR